jgi:predicted RNA-binding protein YlqC (UPF0109 family)
MTPDTPLFEGPDFGSFDQVDDADEVETDEIEIETDADADADEADADEIETDAAEDEDDETEEAEAHVPRGGADDDSGNRVSGGVARSVLEHVARSIVDEPDAVVVGSDAGRNGTRFDLHVAPGDMGRIIGKRGRVAQALRVLVRAAAAREGSDATVDIVD